MDNLFRVTINKDGRVETRDFSEEEYNSKVVPFLKSNYSQDQYSVVNLQTTAPENIEAGGQYVVTATQGNRTESKAFTGEDLQSGKLAEMQKRFPNALTIQSVVPTEQEREDVERRQISAQVRAGAARVGKVADNAIKTLQKMSDTTPAQMAGKLTKHNLYELGERMVAESIYKPVERTVERTDEDGNAVLDENGNPVYDTVTDYELRTPEELREYQQRRNEEHEYRSLTAQIADLDEQIRAYSDKEKEYRRQAAFGSVRPEDMQSVAEGIAPKDELKARKAELLAKRRELSIYKEQVESISSQADEILKTSEPILANAIIASNVELPDDITAKAMEKSGPDADTWQAADYFARQAMKTINAPDDTANGFVAFLKGHGDTFSDADFWLQGLQSIYANHTTKRIFDKIGDKLKNLSDENLGRAATDEDFDNLLTDAEKAVLKAFVADSEAQALRAYDINNRYTSGQTSAESIGFMAQFLLTGGVGKAASSGLEKAFTKWLQKATNKVARNAISKGLGRGAAEAAMLATKGAIKTAEAVAVPIVRSLPMTFLQTGLYNDYAQKLTERDASGNLVYNYGSALLPALRDAGLEVWSEQALEPLLAVAGSVMGVAGRAIMKDLEKAGVSSAKARYLKTKLSDIGDFVHNREAMKILTDAGFDGFLEEMGEEYLGAAVSAMWDGGEAWKQIANWDGFTDMAVAFAPMSVLGGGMQMYNYAKRNVYYKQSLLEMSNILHEAGVSDEDIKSMLDRKTNTLEDLGNKIKDIIKPVIESGNLSIEQTRAVWKFVDATAQNEIADALIKRAVKDRRVATDILLRDQIGREYYSTNSEGERTVSFIEDEQGNRRYVITGVTDGQGGFLSYDSNGEDVKFIQPTESMQTMKYDDFLDAEFDNQRKRMEAERMQREKQMRRQTLAEQLAQGREIELYNDATQQKQKYTLLRWNDTEALVATEVNGKVVEEVRPLAQIANALGVDLSVLTDAEREQAEVDKAIVLDTQIEGVNQFKGSTVQLGGQTGMLARVYAVANEAGGRSIKANLIVAGGNIVTVDVSEQELNDLQSTLDEAAAQQDADPKGEKKRKRMQERQEKQSQDQAYSAVKKRYTNPDGTVREADFLADNPEMYARYSDEKYGRDDTNSTIEANIQTAAKQVAAAMEAKDAETDPDRKQALREAYNNALAHLDNLNDLMAKRNHDESSEGALSEEAAAEKVRQMTDQGLTEDEVAELAIKSIEEARERMAMIPKPEVTANVVSYLKAKQEYKRVIGEEQKKIDYWTSILQAPMTKAERSDPAKADARYRREMMYLATEASKVKTEAAHAAIGERMKEVSKRFIGESIKDVNTENTNVIISTGGEISEDMKRAGCSKTAIGQVLATMESGTPVSGFYNSESNTIFFIAENNRSVASARDTFVHEDQHRITKQSGLVAKLLQRLGLENATEEEAKAVLLPELHRLNNTDFYDGKDVETIADEIISYAKERLVNGTLASANVSEKIVTFVKNIDYERRKESTGLPSSGRNDNGSSTFRVGSQGDEQTPLAESVSLEGQRRGSPAGGKETDREVAPEESVTNETEALSQGDAVRFSIKTEKDLEEKILEFADSKEADRLSWVKDQITSIVQETSDLIDYIHAGIAGDPNYDAFAKKDPTLRVDWRDGVEKPIVTWVRNNIEYKYDMSADTFCINNEGLETVLASPVMADIMLHIAEYTYNTKAEDEGHRSGFTSDDYLLLYETLRDLGFVVPCKGCFDAAARFKMLPSVAQTFVDMVNRTIDERNADPEAFDASVRETKAAQRDVNGFPTGAANKEAAIRLGVAGDKITEHIDWTQLMSAEGQTKLLSDWGGIFRAWQRTGAGRPKDKLLPEPYTGQIMSTTTTIIAPYGETTPSFRDMDVNQGTGLRRNSHSEFRPTLAVDEFQFMRDAWLKKLCVFKYMKELDDVRLFHNFGVKYNMSTFPAWEKGSPVAGLRKDGGYAIAEESVGGREYPYVGEDGKTHYDGYKGLEEAKSYINKDCSLSCIAFSIPHFIKLLTDVPTPRDWNGLFGSLIPFHASGATGKSLTKQGLGLARAMEHGSFMKEAFSDYDKGVTNFEDVQNDRYGEGWYVIAGSDAGKSAAGHKWEYPGAAVLRNESLGVTLYKSVGAFLKMGGNPELVSSVVLDKNGKPKIDKKTGKAARKNNFTGEFYMFDTEGTPHPLAIDYNDKVRELGTDYAYKEAADFYINELRGIGCLPRFDFEIPEEKFLEMCEAAQVDPMHPKLGWKGAGHNWTPADAESYYSVWCDYGMTDPATGKLSPHRPVLDGQTSADSFRKALPENYLEIIKDGLQRYTSRRSSEEAMLDGAVKEFCRREVELGKMDQQKVDEILEQHKGEFSDQAMFRVSDKATQEEMEIIKASARVDGSFMLAPNGKPTNLSEEQWALTRTTNFKNWFGDWINDPASASKVVDENGEPRVMYHGSNWKALEEKSGEAVFEMRDGMLGRGAYFTSSLEDAAEYADERLESLPEDVDEDNRLEFLEDNYVTDYFVNIRNESDMATKDGSLIVVAKSPNQIKSATDNAGTFNSENDDIRFRYRPNQKGYGVREDGTAASSRALAAEEEGRFTAGKFRQNYHITKASFDVLKSLGLFSLGEWHHTGKSMKKSDYFGWEDEDMAARYAEHKKEIDSLVKDLDKLDWVWEERPEEFKRFVENKATLETDTKDLWDEEDRQTRAVFADESLSRYEQREKVGEIRNEFYKKREERRQATLDSYNMDELRKEYDAMVESYNKSLADETGREAALMHIADLLGQDKDDARIRVAILSKDGKAERERESTEESVVSFRVLDENSIETEDDRRALEAFAKGETLKVVRSMQEVEIDGVRYAMPPMAAKVDGEWVLGLRINDDGTLEPTILKADEHPELADSKGHFKLDKGNGKSLKAAYNPYWHVTTEGMLNDQFAEAQDRPNLITVEGEIPLFELEGGYKAEKAKDSVGVRKDWKPGIIQGQLSGRREVILSRYFKGLRVVPTEEVVDNIYDTINGKIDVMPTNVIPPAVREGLEARGIKFVKTDNSNQLLEGEHAGDNYTFWYGKNAMKSRAKKFKESAGKENVSLRQWMDENGRTGQLPEDYVAKYDKRFNRKKDDTKHREDAKALFKVAFPGIDLDSDDVRFRAAVAGTAFSGGGLIEAGLRGVIAPSFAIEYDERISGVYRSNFGDHMITADIGEVSIDELPHIADGQLDFFHASPVCKRYSTMNNNAGETPIDTKTAKATADIIRKGRPSVVTIENVAGYKGSDALRYITAALEENGYTYDINVYDASDYGAATSRKRLIVRAVRDGELPPLPEKVSEKVSWDSVIADLIDYLPEDKLAQWQIERLEAEGIDYKKIDKPMFVFDGGSPNGKARYAYAGVPLPTIVAKGSADRIILPGGVVKRATPRVLARITGLPDSYRLPKQVSLAHTVVGNGVPVKLTEAVIAPLLDKIGRENGGGSTRYRVANNNQQVFVSNALSSLDKIPMKKGNAQAWINKITQAGGMKKEEDKWIGLTDWLKSQKGEVTKEQVADYIRENQVRIEEVNYGVESVASQIMEQLDSRFPGFSKAFELDEDNRFYMFVKDYGKANRIYRKATGEKLPDSDYEELSDWATRMAYETPSEMRKINYTRLNYTEGGLDNNREIALTVPTIEPYNQDDKVHFGDAGNGRAVAWIRFGEVQAVEDRWEHRESAELDAAKEAYSSYRKKLFETHRKDAESMADERRLPAYMRNATILHSLAMESFTDKERKKLAALLGEEKRLEKESTIHIPGSGKVLVIDEIQSKRHQDGKENGYQETNTDGVPDAPFRENWHELAFKRMVRLAAEEGYDMLAWTPGYVQADRYHLRGLVEDIHNAGTSKSSQTGKDLKNIVVNFIQFIPSHWGVDENGVIAETYNRDGEIISGAYDGKNLADVVGKGVAEQIMSMEEGATIPGNDLSVGGEGMNNFYDNRIVNYANKFGKKWGVKVEDIDLSSLDHPAGWHSMKITPEMKESVMEGQTMFRVTPIAPEVRDEMEQIAAIARVNGTYMKAPNGAETKLDPEQWAMVRTKNFKEWFGDWESDTKNASKIIDENGEPMVVYHGTDQYFNTFRRGRHTNGNMWGNGFYFAKDEEEAYGWGERAMIANISDDYRVIPGFLSIRNPLELYGSNIFSGLDQKTIDEVVKRLDPEHDSEIIDALLQGEAPKADFGVARDRLADVIRELGYDAITGYYHDQYHYMVFSPSQIKSATDNNGDFTPDPDIRFRTHKEAVSFLEEIRKDAEAIEPRELTEDVWENEIKGKFFNTPIGKVKFGENQYDKNSGKGRTKEFGMVLPTIQRPDMIFEEHDYEEGADRKTKYVFVKTFVKEDGSKYTNYASVSVLKNGMEVVHSSHRLRDKQVLNKIEKEQMLWNRLESTDSTSSAQGGSTDQNIALTKGKDTNSSDKSKNKFRVTPEQDAEYMKAVESGDMKKAQQMVTEAAEAAGFTVKGYHGSPKFFSVFDPSDKESVFGKYKFGDHSVSYFSSDRDNARSFMGNSESSTLYDVLLRMDNPVVIRNQKKKDNITNTAFNIENKYLDRLSHNLFDEIFDKWESEIYPDIDEVNKDLLFLGMEIRKEGEYYVLYRLGNNSMFGSESLIDSASEIDELFSNRDDISDQWFSVDEETGEESNIYSTDEAVQLILGANKFLGEDYDGIIIPEIFDSASIFGSPATDFITLNSPSQIKSADPVTYDDEGNVIPLSERFDYKSDDIRFRSVNDSQKKADGSYAPMAEMTDDIMFRVSKNNRAIIGKWLDKWGEAAASRLSEEDIAYAKQSVLDYLDGIDDATVQLAYAKWFCSGAIRMGEEDMPKVEQAVRIAKNHKTDPLQFDSPMAIINKWPSEVKEKPINPDEVSTLHKAKELPNGITIYDVDDSDKSRWNMRQIINTHFGKDCSPWCLLQGDGNGNLTDQSASYWEHYGAYPKQVAFKDGKLLAFSANNKDTRLWWDRQDKSHEGIPVVGKIKGDALGRSATIEYDMNTGEVKDMTDIHKGNQQNGLYQSWFSIDGGLKEEVNLKNGLLEGEYRVYHENGQPYIQSNYKDGRRDGEYRWFYRNGQLREEAFFKDGKREGEYRLYYENGQLKEESSYKNDRHDGEFREYYENGQMNVQENYKDGNLDGEYRKYFENGQMKEESFYKDGMRGDYREYYENGQLKRESFRNNVEHYKEVREYYENGQLEKVSLYKNGKLVESHIYDYDDNRFRAAGIPISQDEVKEMFDRMNGNEVNRALFNRISGIIDKLGLEYQYGVESERAAGEAGFSGWIAFDKPYFDSKDVSDQEKANTILHEMIHQATMHIIKASRYEELMKKKGLEDVITPEVKNAIAELESIHERLKENPILKREYGMTNVLEMLAELSDPIFRLKLKSLNVWETIKTLLRKIFGLDVKTEYASIRKAFDTILDNFNRDVYDAVRKEAKAYEGQRDNANASLAKEDVRFRIGPVAEMKKVGMSEYLKDSQDEFLNKALKNISGSALYAKVTDKALKNGGLFAAALEDELAELAAKDELTADEAGFVDGVRTALADHIKVEDDKLTANDVLWLAYDDVHRTDEGFFSRVHNQQTKRRLDQARSVAAEMTLDDYLEAAEKDRNDIIAQYKAMVAVTREMEDIGKAMGARADYDRNTVGRIVSLANSLMESRLLDNVSRGEIKRLTGVIRRTTGMRNIQSRVSELYNLILSNQLRNLNKMFKDELKKKATKVNNNSVVEQSALDLLGQKFMDAFKENLDAYSEDENGLLTISQTLADRLQAALDRAAESGEASAEMEFVGLSMARNYIEQVKASELEEQKLREEMDAAKARKDKGELDEKSYREFMKETRRAIVENRTERVNALTGIVQNLQDFTAASHTLALDFARKQKARVEQIHHDANSDMEGRPADEHPSAPTFMQKVANNSFIQFFVRPLGTFDQMLRMFGSKSVNGEGYLWNRFMRGWVDATGKEFKAVQSAHKTLDDKVSEIYGKKMTWNDLYTIESKMPVATVEFIDGDTIKEHELTQGNLLYILLADAMTDGRMKLRAMGITEEKVEDIRKQMDGRFLEIADWLVHDFLPSRRTEYNKIYERMFGASMGKVENYFPLKVLSNARVQQVDVATANAEAGTPSTVTGSIMRRTRNALALDILNADAFSLVIDHINKMEHWAAFAEWNRDLSDLLSYRRFRNQVQNMTSIYGAKERLWKEFVNVSMIAAGSYKAKTADLDRYFMRVASGVTAAKISLRVFTAIKQFLSFPAYFSEANPIYLLEGMYKGWKWSMGNLPMFEKRWKSRQMGDHILAASEGILDPMKEGLARIGMTPNAAVDAFTVSIGAYAIYRTKYDRYIKLGYSADRAEERAKQDAVILYNETQQSNEAAFLSTMQSDRSVATAMLTVFRNSSMGYQRQVHDALRNYKKMRTPGYRSQSIEYMTKQLVRDGVDQATAERGARMLYRRQSVKDAVRLMIFGFGLQFFWNLASSLPYLLLGDDDDKKNEMLEAAALKAVSGPVEGLTGGSLMSEALNKVITGESLSDWDPSLLPLVSDFKNLYQEFGRDNVRAINDVINLAVQIGIGVNPQTLEDGIVAVIDACNGDLGVAKEAMLLSLRLIQAPQSSIDQLYLDEVEMSAVEARNLSVPELAERYAKYKIMKGAGPLTPAYGHEAYDEKYQKLYDRFNKKATERLSESDLDKAYLTYADESEALKKSVKELQDKAKGGDEDAQQELNDIFFSEDYGKMLRFNEANSAVTREIAAAVQAKTAEEMKEHMLEAERMRREIAETIVNDEPGRYYYRNQFYQYTNGVLPGMAKEAKRYKDEYLKAHPEYEEQRTRDVDEVQARVDRITSRIKAIDAEKLTYRKPGKNGKLSSAYYPKYTKRVKELNEEKARLSEQKKKLREDLSGMKKVTLSPQDYMPQDIYNSDMFQTYLKFQDEGSLSGNTFVFKDIREVNEALKEETDPEKRRTLMEKRDRLMRLHAQEVSRSLSGVDDDEDFTLDLE